MSRAISTRAPKIPASMQATIVWTAAGLGGTGFLSVFTGVADIGIITAAWATMFVTLAGKAGRKMDKDKALKIIAGLFMGVGGFAAGVKIVETGLAYTGIGTIPAMVLNAGTNAAMTYVVGRAAAQVFLSRDRATSVKQIAKSIARIAFGHRHGFGSSFA